MGEGGEGRGKEVRRKEMMVCLEAREAGGMDAIGRGDPTIIWVVGIACQTKNNGHCCT